MCGSGGLDILDLIGIYPKSDEIKDLRYSDTCDIGFSLIADFSKFEQFYSRFEMGFKLAIFTRRKIIWR